MKGTAEAQLQWLVDRAQISDLLYSFAAALDTKDWKKYADNYADNGYIELPDPRAASASSFVLHKDKMPELVGKSLGRYTATHHISTNHQITIDGDEANSRSYLQAVHVGTAPADHWTAGGWYDCRYIRTTDGWKFFRVKLTCIWVAGEIGAIKPD
jgi:hypothetical protein